MCLHVTNNKTDDQTVKNIPAKTGLHGLGIGIGFPDGHVVDHLLYAAINIIANRYVVFFMVLLSFFGFPFFANRRKPFPAFLLLTAFNTSIVVPWRCLSWQIHI